jgi:hypothetical protein
MKSEFDEQRASDESSYCMTKAEHAGAPHQIFWRAVLRTHVLVLLFASHNSDFEKIRKLSKHALPANNK